MSAPWTSALVALVLVVISPAASYADAGPRLASAMRKSIQETLDSMAYLSIDYAAQKIEMWKLVKGQGMFPSIQGGEIEVANEEPLKRELVDFIDAVVARRAPLVTGEQGRRALALAQQITDKMTTETESRSHDTPQQP